MNKVDTHPHDLEVTIKYRDGKHQTFIVNWETISTFRELHNVSALMEAYKNVIADRNKRPLGGGIIGTEK